LPAANASISGYIGFFEKHNSSVRTLTITLLVFWNACQAQPLRDKLQGSWVCLKITDSVGRVADGELGASNSYLKFRFRQTKLFITQAPFDIGTMLWLNFGEDSFDLIGVEDKLKQFKYKVVSINTKQMILRTVNHKNKTITYQFANQNDYANNLDELTHFRDLGKIVLNFTYYPADNTFFQYASYQIENSLLNLIPSPLFNGKEFPTFATYFEARFLLPRSFDIKTNSKTMIVEFDVSDQGIENIVVVEGVQQELDEQVFNVILDSRKRWTPVLYEGKVIKTRIRLGFLFLYSEL
jgi:hypothetical protein